MLKSRVDKLVNGKVSPDEVEHIKSWFRNFQQTWTTWLYDESPNISPFDPGVYQSLRMLFVFTLFPSLSYFACILPQSWIHPAHSHD